MRKLLFCFLLVLTLVSPLVLLADTDIPVASNTDLSNTGIRNSYAYYYGQTFIPNQSGTVSKVSLYMCKEGSITEDFVVEIRTTSGGLPTSTVIANGSLAPSEVGTTFEWKDITLSPVSNDGEITQGTTYAFVIKKTSGTEAYYRMKWDYNAGYPDGNVLWSTDDSSWSSSTTYDFVFKVFIAGSGSTNEPPTVDILSVSPSSIYRGQSIQVKINATDPEGNLSNVYVNITAPSGSNAVTNGIATYNSSDGYYYYAWSAPASAELGSYNVSAKAVDNESQTATDLLANAFTVQNVNPTVHSVSANPSTVQLNQNTQIIAVCDDFEDANTSLTVTLDLEAPNGTIVVNDATMTYNDSDSKFYYTTPSLDAEGTWTATVTCQDTDSGTDTGSTTFSVVTISVNSVASVPYNSTRPATFHLKANVTCNDPSQTTVNYTVKNPSGAVFDSGGMTYNATDDLWHASVSVSQTDPVGYYNVTVNATESDASDEKEFENVFRVDNVAPTVVSIAIDPDPCERGTQLTITVDASDPEHPESQLDVSITLDPPTGSDIVLGTATWDGSDHIKTWTPSATAVLGTYNAMVTVTDPDGDQTQANKTFVVQNSPPTISSCYAVKSDLVVGESTWIYASVTDFEDLGSELNVTIYIYAGAQLKTSGFMTYDSSLGKFKWAFSITDVGVYDVKIEAEDSDSGTTTREFSEVVEVTQSTSTGGGTTSSSTTTEETPTPTEEIIDTISDWKDRFKSFFSDFELPTFEEVTEFFTGINAMLGTLTLLGAIAAASSMKRSRGPGRPPGSKDKKPRKKEGYIRRWKREKKKKWWRR